MFSVILAFIKGVVESADEPSPEEWEWIGKVDSAIQNKAILKIYKNNETGIEQWSIIDPVDPDYWLNSFDTLEECHQWCDALGLKYES